MKTIETFETNPAEVQAAIDVLRTTKTVGTPAYTAFLHTLEQMLKQLQAGQHVKLSPNTTSMPDAKRLAGLAELTALGQELGL